jgi:hypothetical protein
MKLITRKKKQAHRKEDIKNSVKKVGNQRDKVAKDLKKKK